MNGVGTAIVLDPVDDVTFTHEAAFAKGTNGNCGKLMCFFMSTRVAWWCRRLIQNPTNEETTEEQSTLKI